MKKPFLDSGFLLTLLVKTGGSPIAWEIARRLETSMYVSMLQIFTAENRLLRETQSLELTPTHRAMAENAVQSLHWYLDQQVIRPIQVDYDAAIDLAYRWQRGARETLPALLLLWPALAVTLGANHFLSFDPRTRELARGAGIKLLPEQL
jgi:hypothetical protein